MSAFREPLFAFRDALPDEQNVSCNGCAQYGVVRILEVGSQMRDGRGSNGMEYRMCRPCARKFLSIMAAEQQERLP